MSVAMEAKPGRKLKPVPPECPVHKVACCVGCTKKAEEVRHYYCTVVGCKFSVIKRFAPWERENS